MMPNCAHCDENVGAARRTIRGTQPRQRSLGVLEDACGSPAMDVELELDCNNFWNDIRLFRKHLDQVALASRECDEMIAKSLILLSDSREAMLRADRVLHQDRLLSGDSAELSR
jgi:hypothetical protein